MHSRFHGKPAGYRSRCTNVKWRSTLLLVGVIVVLSAAVDAVLADSTQPRVFAPGVISGPANDDAATFIPDGASVCFYRSNVQDYDFRVLNCDGKRCEIAPVRRRPANRAGK